MSGVLLDVSRWAMLAFLVAGMLECGLGLALRQVLTPLRDTRRVILSLVANFLIVPLVAAGIARVLGLDPPIATGLLLLGLAPGAPFLPKVAELAQGNPGFAVGLMVLLLVGTVVCLPVMGPLIITGARIDTWKIGQSLFFLMLLPLLAGLLLRATFPAPASRLRPALGFLANLSALIALVLIVALNLGSVLRLLGTGAILAAVALVLLSSLIGWLLGGPDPGIRRVLALGTGLRNVAAALLVGAQNFTDPMVNVMVIVSALVGLVLLLFAARAMRRRARAVAGAAAEEEARPRLN